MLISTACGRSAGDAEGRSSSHTRLVANHSFEKVDGYSQLPAAMVLSDPRCDLALGAYIVCEVHLGHGRVSFPRLGGSSRHWHGESPIKTFMQQASSTSLFWSAMDFFISAMQARHMDMLTRICRSKSCSTLLLRLWRHSHCSTLPRLRESSHH